MASGVVFLFLVAGVAIAAYVGLGVHLWRDGKKYCTCGSGMGCIFDHEKAERERTIGRTGFDG